MFAKIEDALEALEKGQLVYIYVPDDSFERKLRGRWLKVEKIEEWDVLNDRDFPFYSQAVGIDDKESYRIGKDRAWYLYLRNQPERYEVSSERGWEALGGQIHIGQLHDDILRRENLLDDEVVVL